MVDAIVVGAGQAGLATAHHLQRRGLPFLMLEAGARPVGSWLRHYDSLKLFSPARYAALPGLPFPGDPDHYPARDEVTAYLEAYARQHRVPLVTGADVTQVLPTGAAFRVLTGDGRTFSTRTLVAATGTYRTPRVPELPGHASFQGRTLHSLEYRQPDPFRGERVVVVGAGNSAVQIAVELARMARVTLAARTPVPFVPQRPLGRDVHDWITWLQVDQLPLGQFGRLPSPRSVFDPGTYRAAFREGRLDQRPMFARFTARGVVWSTGREEAVDSVVFATGYRTGLEYLFGTGALDVRGEPVQRLGRSLTVPGLYYAGLSGQRAFASATLRGAGPDAELVVRYLAGHLQRQSSGPPGGPLAPLRAAWKARRR
ncbi:NAD(P)/FAD-dependent oxidoreductase (plasmid) [Deinococcus taeanensis]|uniref:flavin-containing monooxygenase n=1 Tax=Deinococcus taeanensis TaxID=2737050 RepID=UPI001CDC3C45|nr:NAD(P)/FAD-dependent oxidoreductase [Deinococcus taeanensis]UBV44543.1 NAD(P)/FAD-dependent oxidoreductase [Deinococcus taeanensis]